MRIEDSLSGFGHAIGEMFGPMLQGFEDNIPGTRAVMVVTLTRPGKDGKTTQLTATLAPESDGVTDVQLRVETIEPTPEPEPEAGAFAEADRCDCNSCLGLPGGVVLLG